MFNKDKEGEIDMKDLIKKGLALGLGLAVVSKEQIEKLVDELVKKGEVSKAESKDLIQELFEKGETERKQINVRFREQFAQLLKDLNIPTKAELERLEQRIQALENEKQESLPK
jgi:polyhydroxyalkanoate synthesis regulator phasin